MCKQWHGASPKLIKSGARFQAALDVKIKMEFGGLHPASAPPFFLEGQYWRTVHPRDWPWPFARVAQSQPAGGDYRDAMKLALLARFSQHNDLRRRLDALNLPVSVHGIPDGVIEEVRAALSAGGC